MQFRIEIHVSGPSGSKSRPHGGHCRSEGLTICSCGSATEMCPEPVGLSRISRMDYMPITFLFLAWLALGMCSPRSLSLSLYIYMYVCLCVYIYIV